MAVAGSPHCVLVGGTASGKKRLAAELSRRSGLPLASMDSLKVYRGMDIGTDKPSAELQARSPFALIDLVGHDENFSAGDWLRAAAELAERTQGPLLFAGGTPFYLRLLLAGLCPAPPADPALRAELAAQWQREGEVAIRARLAALDPRSAVRLLPGDAKRVLRALEVALLTGRSLSDWQHEHTRAVLPGRFRVVVLEQEPGAHAAAIAARVDAMLAAGLLEETARLAQQAPFAREPARAIGYAEALACLAGRLAVSDVRERIVVRTRQLVRRQRQHLAGLERLAGTLPALASFERRRATPETEAQTLEDVVGALRL